MGTPLPLHFASFPTNSPWSRSLPPLQWALDTPCQERFDFFLFQTNFLRVLCAISCLTTPCGNELPVLERCCGSMENFSRNPRAYILCLMGEFCSFSLSFTLNPSHAALEVIRAYFGSHPNPLIGISSYLLGTNQGADPAGLELLGQVGWEIPAPPKEFPQILQGWNDPSRGLSPAAPPELWCCPKFQRQGPKSFRSRNERV